VSREQVQGLVVGTAVATVTFASNLAFVGSAWAAAGLTAVSSGIAPLAVLGHGWARSRLGMAEPGPLDLPGIGTELPTPD
jgi:hypothetical protein